MTKTLPRFASLILLSTTLACGDSGESPTDAGTSDTGTQDAGTSDTGPRDSGQVTLTSLTVLPATFTLDVGQTQGLAVTAQYSDGSSELITTEGTFSTSDDAVATVDNVGTVTGVGGGSATITVGFMGQDASATVTVNADPPMAFIVFDDQYANGVTLEGFGGANNDISVDNSDSQEGMASLRVEVPGGADFTGGAMRIDTPQNLTAYDALTFWAKASQAASLNVTGIQNDAAVTTYSAERRDVALTTNWTKYTIPIPNPSRVSADQGLFHFAEGAEDGAYTIWFDLIQYETVGAALSNVRPAIPDATLNLGVGGTGNVGAPTLTVAVDGTDVAIVPAIASFDLTSSNDNVATVALDGAISAVAAGTATVTAELDGTAAAGSVLVNVQAQVPDLVVFDDDYAPGVSFAPFGGSNNNLSIDMSDAQVGTASLRIEVPATGTGYTGGAMVANPVQNVSAYNAVSFWAKASADNPLNVSGLGNDGMNNVLQAEFNGVPLTSTWTQFFIPIPDASLLTALAGLFHFAEGDEHNAYTIWLDDIRYTVLDSAVLNNPRPAIATETVGLLVGGTVNVNGTSVVYSVNGNDQVTSAARPYFSYDSSDPSVATVDGNGVVSGVMVGTASITGTLNGVAAAGVTTVNVAAATEPGAAPTPPTDPANTVTSIYSDEYTPATNANFDPPWDNVTVSDFTIGNENMKRYDNLVFAGIDFSGMTDQLDGGNWATFRFDVWNGNSTVLRVKVVDFGPDGIFSPPPAGDDVEHLLVYDANSTPALQSQTWQSFSVPMTDLTGLTTRNNIAQIVIEGSNSTVFIDNIYFVD